MRHDGQSDLEATGDRSPGEEAPSTDRVSVNISALGVDQARWRLDGVRGRLLEGVSYPEREWDLLERGELEGKILAEASAIQLRSEWDAARERAKSVDESTRDADAGSHDASWAQYVALTFLDRADTADLSSAAAALTDPSETGWRNAVESELGQHRRVDAVADMALEELSRWDSLDGSQADADRLRTLAEAAEKFNGPRGLAQFLDRLDAADHPFHTDQLQHFCATVGPETVAELKAALDGRDVDFDLAPAQPKESFWESFWDDLASGQVRDNLATIANVVAERVVEDAKALGQAIANPIDTIEAALDGLKDLPGDLVAMVKALPELPDRLADAARTFAQMDEKEQVEAISRGLYEVEKGLVGELAAARVAEAARTVRAVDDVPEVGEAGAKAHAPSGPDASGGTRPVATPEATGVADPPAASPTPGTAGAATVPEPVGTAGPVGTPETPTAPEPATTSVKSLGVV